MIIPRFISMGLRLAQFLTTATVLAVLSHFFSIYARFLPDRESSLPAGLRNSSFDLLIFPAFPATFSVVLALVWLVPTTCSMAHWITDLVVAGA
ncbi:hypothetical protein CC86DRAFT_412413 [Ophiobolus disseminans]|uniref:Uncharacterized protein n=1 Tax=Ophiobolus disseminans TaxID=1469910 RepID=A0A6A6ZI03_9PLEO|nr:hypothetical protein CC86DRAFT_412413 [Ophiobolus disseminans]